MSSRRPHIFRHLLLLILLVVVVVCMRPLLSHGSGPGEAELAQRPNRLTVLTWNTHQMGQFRKPIHNEVLRYLTQQDADIICLQEVDVYKTPEFLTLAEVKKTLGQKYPYSYIDFAVYNRRRQFGNMVWSKYPLINKHTVEYEIRANLSSRCDVVINDDTLRLIVNHLESNRFDSKDLSSNSLDYGHLRQSAHSMGQKWGAASCRRHEQARIVRHEVKSSPYPVIVVGDFNDIALSYTYHIIAKGLHDAWLETGWFQWGATCEKMGVGLRIDYILSDSSIKPVSCQVPHVSGSDHYPVVATLAW